MNSAKVIQLICAFLSESLEIIPRPEEALVDNYDPDIFANGAFPHYFERLEDTLRVTNANILLGEALQTLCQYIQYDFEMMLHPQKYEKEWRQILSIMIDFTKFKNEYAEHHLGLVEEIQTNVLELNNMTLELGNTIDQKLASERKRLELIEQEQRVRF